MNPIASVQPTPLHFGLLSVVRPEDRVLTTPEQNLANYLDQFVLRHNKPQSRIYSKHQKHKVELSPCRKGNLVGVAITIDGADADTTPFRNTLHNAMKGLKTRITTAISQ